MKLNEEEKNKLRRLIEEQLVNVPDGKRIHLDKEILEELLFETIVYKKETGEFLKLPVWSGSFLRNIDLSEISFADVSWSIMGRNIDILSDTFIVDEKYGVIDNDVLNIIFKYHLKDNEIIDYSYTNANIDLNISFEAKKANEIAVTKCSFSGVDLSKFVFDSFSYFENVDLSYTNINISSCKQSNSYFMNCNFYGNSYSHISLPSILFRKEADVYSCFDTCSFKGTGLNVVYTECPNELYERKDFASYQFAELINEGYFDGCFIDGKKILPYFLRPQYSDDSKYNSNSQIIKQYVYSSVASSKEQVYSNFEEELFGSIINNIEEQKKSFRR